MARADPNLSVVNYQVKWRFQGPSWGLCYALANPSVVQPCRNLIHLSSVVRVSGGCRWRVQRPWELEAVFFFIISLRIWGTLKKLPSLRRTSYHVPYDAQAGSWALTKSWMSWRPQFFALIEFPAVSSSLYIRNSLLVPSSSPLLCHLPFHPSASPSHTPGCCGHWVAAQKEPKRWACSSEGSADSEKLSPSKWQNWGKEFVGFNPKMLN